MQFSSYLSMQLFDSLFRACLMSHDDKGAYRHFWMMDGEHLQVWAYFLMKSNIYKIVLQHWKKNLNKYVTLISIEWFQTKIWWDNFPTKCWFTVKLNYSLHDEIYNITTANTLKRFVRETVQCVQCLPICFRLYISYHYSVVPSQQGHYSPKWLQ